MLAELAEGRGCDAMKGQFCALRDKARPDVVTGVMWIRDCDIRRHGTALTLALATNGWQRVEKAKEKAGATFEVAQEIEVNEEGAWAETVGAFGTLVGQSPENQAEDRAKDEGKRDTASQLSHGLGATINLCDAEKLSAAFVDGVELPMVKPLVVKDIDGEAVLSIGKARCQVSIVVRSVPDATGSPARFRWTRPTKEWAASLGGPKIKC